MSGEVTYRVELPDGTVVTRNSPRTYTHAIARLVNGKWSAPSFAGSLELAEREMGVQQRRTFNIDVQEWRLIPVSVNEPKAKVSRPRVQLRTSGGQSVTITAMQTGDAGAADAGRHQLKPTEHGISRAQWGALEDAYAYFNRELFDGKLLPVVLNFSRHANSYGFFAPNRWFDAGDKLVTHEISLNPSHLLTRDLRATMSTLVHEMVHCWQEEHGERKSKRGYHNGEWADKMESVGLMPTSTGLPDGKRTGSKVSHMVIDGGAYDRAFEAMPEACKLPWLCREPSKEEKEKRPKSKVKYTCQGCDARAWAKPTASLKCGECDQAMVAEVEEGDDDGDA